MGQIFNRIKRITKSYLENRNLNENYTKDFLDEDEELKKLFDELSSSDNKNNNQTDQFDVKKMNMEIASKILGLSENASNEEIKIAYKQKIKEYHPDKVADMGEEIRNLAKIRTQQINQAYEFLKKERNFK